MPKKTEAPPAAPKKKAKIDPEIQKLRDEYNLKVKAYMDTRESKRILRTIIQKRIPRLCQADKDELLEFMMTQATPPLPHLKREETQIPQEDPWKAKDTPTQPTNGPTE